MKNQWLIILWVMFFASCSSNLFVNKNIETFRDLNQKLHGEKVDLELKSGKTVKCRIKNINIDTIFYNHQKVSTKEIVKIHI